jgi:16S rRNA (cytidine1402-2'-O)-methyltransferase
VKTLLRDVLVVFGDRQVAIARELTKLHEEVRRGSVSGVLAELGDADVKGEVVVVIAGAAEAEPIDIDACVAEARELVDGGMRKRDAARAVAERHRISANEVYRALLERPA